MIAWYIDDFPLQRGGFQDFHVYFCCFYQWIVQPAVAVVKDGYTTNGPRQHTRCKTAELRVAKWGANGSPWVDLIQRCVERKSLGLHHGNDGNEMFKDLHPIIPIYIPMIPDDAQS